MTNPSLFRSQGLDAFSGSSLRVIYFVAEVSGEVCLQEEEIYYGVWLSLSDAMDRLTYPEAKTMLSEVIKMLSNMDQ
jgi:hypothetical protein